MRIDNSGQATVEFALVAVLFLGMLFAVIDIGAMLFVNLTMQHAVREGTRYAITGRTDLGTDRRSALVQKIIDSSFGLYDKNTSPHDQPGSNGYNNPDIRVIQPGNVTFTTYSGTRTTTTGQPGQIVVVSLAYSWPLMTPIKGMFSVLSNNPNWFANNKYSFSVKATARLEGFPP